ncbi:haloacid dehalogenase type II [Halorarum salinum]|uniref:Haloacid dehalogenase type II n=1 Tax=Halorarum salinum TaxID=2743089 RepID=A0A7D5QIL5_9EURY|nr:haloacid dehalogenase type II [Halobaculum salinum]QLG63683.1 haloacid dehalogenase type II [Halobaculum salinum]
MSFDPDAVETIAFDSYGTIVDVDGVEEPLSNYVENPGTVAELWRDRSLTYAMVANAIEEYDSFYEMNRHALRYALEAVDVDLDEDDRAEILSTYHELPVFDDVRDGMRRLDEAGYDCYVVSNGNEEMLESMVEQAELGDLIADTISADEVERFKPEADLYRHALDRIGIPAERVAYVAAGWWDVPGAIHVGMQGVWINRGNAHWGPYDTEPALTIETFHDLADALES